MTETAAEWISAAERGRAATEQACDYAVSLPWGSFVEIDLENGHARVAVQPACAGQKPGPERGAYGLYVQPSQYDGEGRPIAATVRLLDRASGLVFGVPFSALSRTDYRDTRDLRTGA